MGVAGNGLKQRAGDQIATSDRQGYVEDPAAVSQNIDVRRHPFPRLSNTESIAAVDRLERRHVEELVPVVADLGTVGIEQIAIGLTKGVVDLGHRMAQSFVGVSNEVERHRVEDVTEKSQVGEELDTAELVLDASVSEPGFELFADRPRLWTHVITVVEPCQVESVVRKESEIAIELLELVQIDEGVPHRVVKLVYETAQAPVPDSPAEE
jgi:hypothetical protein